MPAQDAPPAGGGPMAPAPPWAELSGTQRAIVLALLRHGRLSRPQIMSLVGISPGSVMRLTAQGGIVRLGRGDDASDGRRVRNDHGQHPDRTQTTDRKSVV